MEHPEHLGPGGRLRHPGGPRRQSRAVTVTIDGRQVDVPAGTSVLRAATEAGVSDPQAVRDRLAQGVRLLPDVPGRGRGRQGRARLLHDAVRRRHGRQHPDRDGARPPPQRHGALPLRPPRGLRRLRPRQLRDPGDGRDRRLRRGALRPAGVARAGRPPAAGRPSQPLLRLRRLLLHRLLPLRARLLRHPGHLRAHRRGPRLRLARSAPAAPTSSPPSACRAAPACRPARRPRCRSTPSSSSACRPARSRPPAPTAASAAPSAPRSRARATTPRSCGWSRRRTAAPTRATAA